MIRNTYFLPVVVLAGIASVLLPSIAAQQTIAAATQPEEENFGVAYSVSSIPAHQPESGTFVERFAMHNYSMRALQPSFITPLVAPDPRLVQYVRASVSNLYTSGGAQTISIGNAKGTGVIVAGRFQFDYLPPSYVEHNNSSAVDGLTDTSVQGKYRIASGDADHGNYVVTAMLGHSFATGTYKNGAATDSFTPTVAAAVGFLKRFDVESSLGGSLPTGQIAAQGRTIAWNCVSQLHATNAVWLEVENNASFYFSGSRDGKMQNFVTPAAFYVFRRKEWKPSHPVMTLDGGMQVATSAFHTYNHNLISEARMLF